MLPQFNLIRTHPLLYIHISDITALDIYVLASKWFSYGSIRMSKMTLVTVLVTVVKVADENAENFYGKIL